MMLFQQVLIWLKKFSSNQQGNLLLLVMVFGAISFSVMVVGVASYGLSEHHASIYKTKSEQAFQIAEAGIEQYRWHLAHNSSDFQDGTNQAGPYLHEYKDKNGTVIGQYSLNIIPPAVGSSVVTIESTGWLNSQPGSKRKIRVKLGFPALTDYAFLSNDTVFVGSDQTIHGKLHANGGIRFEGVADAPITSAVATYVCKPKDFKGCDVRQTKQGIWGGGGPTQFWKYPVPSQDFDTISATLSDVKSAAEEAGVYLSSSGKQGWRLSFQNNGTVQVAKVLTTTCYKGKDVGSKKKKKRYCVDLKTTDVATIYALPANGYIYVDDTVWVDGVVRGRVTLATGAGKSIIINTNLTYYAKDGTDVIGLMADQNILLPHDSPDSLEINGVLLARHGALKRYYYSGHKKTQLTLYGSLISYGVWTWNWLDKNGNVDSGYQQTTLTYDANLTYGPPPGFPVGVDYNIISWEEVK